ncbi:hypothetical protein B566_EDAN017142 [Ephemera danica]|nr:hypothetical protein B566_EDAN017142 [Ephemera danica]
MKRGLFAIVSISFKHSHRVTNATAWNLLRPSNQTLQELDQNFRNVYKQKDTDTDRLTDTERVAEERKTKLEKIGYKIGISEYPLCIAVFSPLMQRFVSAIKCQQTIFIDTSASSDQTNTALTTVLAATKAGAVPIGILLHDSQSTTSYTNAFTLLKDLIDREYNLPILNFMVDDSAALHEALKSNGLRRTSRTLSRDCLSSQVLRTGGKHHGGGLISLKLSEWLLISLFSISVSTPPSLRTPACSGTTVNVEGETDDSYSTLLYKLVDPGAAMGTENSIWKPSLSPGSVTPPPTQEPLSDEDYIPLVYSVEDHLWSTQSSHRQLNFKILGEGMSSYHSYPNCLHQPLLEAPQLQSHQSPSADSSLALVRRTRPKTNQYASSESKPVSLLPEVL